MLSRANGRVVTFQDHFSGDSARYAAFRPSYPAEMIRWITSQAIDRRLAWDCATGNGQAAVQLAEHFDKVIATDASAEQLRAAITHPRVHYSVADEQVPDIADASACLVTVAQALHWLDLPRFYAETDRVLALGGVLAVWCYRRPRIDPATDAVIDWFHDERVGPDWPSDRRHVEAGYRTLAFPYPEMPADEWFIAVPMSRTGFIGYVGTWSAVRHSRKRQAVDPILELTSRLAEVWPNETDARTVTWPVSLRIGRRD